MDTVKLTSKAGKIPHPPKDLVLRINKINNPNIIKVVEEVEKYRKENETNRCYATHRFL